jgi:hypothetical protein
VETVSGVLREVVDQKRIAELPLNGRNPVELVGLIPGVVTGPASSSLSQNGGLAANGARATASNYMLDGGDNNDPEEGVAATPNCDAHVHMVRHQMSLNNLAFLLPGQSVENLPQMTARLLEDRFAPPLGLEHNMVLAVPF